MAMGAEGSVTMGSGEVMVVVAGGGDAASAGTGTEGDWSDEGVGFEADRVSGASATLHCVPLAIISPSSASIDFFCDNCPFICRCLARRCGAPAGLRWLGASSESESESEGGSERYMVSAWSCARIEGEMVSCGRSSDSRDSGRGGDLESGGEEEVSRGLMEQGGRCAGCGGMAVMSCSSIPAGCLPFAGDLACKGVDDGYEDIAQAVAGTMAA